MTDGFAIEVALQSEWFRHALGVRVALAHGDAPSPDLALGLVNTQARIRAFVDAGQWCGSAALAPFALSSTEAQLLWLFTSHAVDARVGNMTATLTGRSDDLVGFDLARRIVYGETPSLAALQETSPSATLRRLSLLERSDGGGPDVHESRWTWAISRRVLAFLHGDMSIDPALANIADIKLTG